jgi:hypothetical protein
MILGESAGAVMAHIPCPSDFAKGRFTQTGKFHAYLRPNPRLQPFPPCLSYCVSDGLSLGINQQQKHHSRDGAEEYGNCDYPDHEPRVPQFMFARECAPSITSLAPVAQDDRQGLSRKCRPRLGGGPIRGRKSGSCRLAFPVAAFRVGRARVHDPLGGQAPGSGRFAFEGGSDAVPLLLERVAVHVIPVLLPESQRVLRPEFDAANPLRAFPRVEMRHY